jgi:hypothetical protein
MSTPDTAQDSPERQIAFVLYPGLTLLDGRPDLQERMLA